VRWRSGTDCWPAKKFRVVREWGPSPIRPFTVEERLDFHRESVLWTFHELRSAKELMEEGKSDAPLRRNVCGFLCGGNPFGLVAADAERKQRDPSCADNCCQHSRRCIVEARGKCNHLPQREKKANG